MSLAYCSLNSRVSGPQDPELMKEFRAHSREVLVCT